MTIWHVQTYILGDNVQPLMESLQHMVFPGTSEMRTGALSQYDTDVGEGYYLIIVPKVVQPYWQILCRFLILL